MEGKILFEFFSKKERKSFQPVLFKTQKKRKRFPEGIICTDLEIFPVKPGIKLKY